MKSAATDSSLICGPADLSALSNAYQRAHLTLSGGNIGGVLDQETKLLLVAELLREGRRSGFDPDRMVAAAMTALAAPSRRDDGLWGRLVDKVSTWAVRWSPTVS